MLQSVAFVVCLLIAAIILPFLEGCVYGNFVEKARQIPTDSASIASILGEEVSEFCVSHSLESVEGKPWVAEVIHDRYEVRDDEWQAYVYFVWQTKSGWIGSDRVHYQSSFLGVKQESKCFGEGATILMDRSQEWRPVLYIFDEQNPPGYTEWRREP